MKKTGPRGAKLFSRNVLQDVTSFIVGTKIKTFLLFILTHAKPRASLNSMTWQPILLMPEASRIYVILREGNPYTCT